MKILVADDSAVLRTAVSQMLKDAGFEVVLAQDGVEAITRFYEERPDLVLLDVQMPKVNGYVVCRLIKEDPAMGSVPVLILTVRTSAEDRYWGEKSGADGYLTKDTLSDEVVTAVQSALASRALRELSGGGAHVEPPEHETDVLTRVCELLDRKLFEATVVNEITAAAVQPVGLDGTVARVLAALRRLVAFDAGGLIFPKERKLHLHLERPLDPGDLEGFVSLSIQHLRELTGSELLPGDVEVVETNDVVGRTEQKRGWESTRAYPLKSQGQLLGVLVLGAHRPAGFGGAEDLTVRTVTPPLATVVDSARSFQTSVENEARATLSSLL